MQIVVGEKVEIERTGTRWVICAPGVSRIAEEEVVWVETCSGPAWIGRKFLRNQSQQH